MKSVRQVFEYTTIDSQPMISIDEWISSLSITEQQEYQQQQQQQQVHHQQPTSPGMTHEDMRRMQQQQHTIRHVKNSIPEYTVGVPVQGQKKDFQRCYLEFKTAYPNKGVENPNPYGVRV